MMVILCLILSIVTFSVYSANNVYPSSQTISGVTTVPCTYYAWQQVYDRLGIALPNWGNAINWLNRATSSGYSTGSTAKANSVAVWKSSAHSYGHVSYVTAVNGSTMTVNEGGMTDSNGKAANGTGIVTGSKVSSIVGTKKSSYSSCTLLGFIYFNGTNTSSVSITCQSGKNTITNTNAILWGRVDKPSNYSVTKIGIKIRREDSTYDSGWSKYEVPSKDYVGYSYMEPYYNMNTELNITLRHATKYCVKFYAKVNGTEFWSEEYSFTTTGSHSYITGSEAAHPHKYYKKCNCGYYYYTGENAATTQSATCTQNAVCKICGSFEGNSLGHAGGIATCKNNAVCTRCGEEYGELKAHSYDSATCTKAKTCKVCDDTIGKALGHKYDAGKITKKSTCKEEGVKTYTCTVCKKSKYSTITKSQTHIYTNSCDKSCNVCKVNRNTNHSYERVVTTKATTTKNGKINYKCSKCGYITSESKVINKIKSIKLSTISYTYNGQVRTPNVIVKDSESNTLKKNTDYTVTYSKGRKNVGLQSVTITFKGNYSGKRILQYKILPQKSNVVKIDTAKKQMKVYVSRKFNQVTGYQIQYATNNKFANAKTKWITNFREGKALIKGLKTKTNYYVRVRTYKTVEGKKYYSGWSTVKSKKTK